MFEKQNRIPSPEEVKRELPLSDDLKKCKEERDLLIKNVIAGRDRRLLLIIGPCSAHDGDAVLEYVWRLKCVEEQVRDTLVIVPRVFTSKPRSLGVGYMGMSSRPDPEGKEDILRGVYAIRRLHLCVLETGLSAADEMLYPENYGYVDDLLSYCTVGARSAEDQLHRLVASGVSVPVGFKNPTNGNLSSMLNSVFAAQNPHVFRYRDWQVGTDGNAYAHAVLRGQENEAGRLIPNYHYDAVMRVLEEYERRTELKNPAIVIDCSHANSEKCWEKQFSVAEEVLTTGSANSEYRGIVKGIMAESFLVAGAQAHNVVFGKSITDSCMGWEDTEKFIFRIAERINHDGL